MLSEKDLNEIKLLKAQNNGLKIQNKDLQRENVELKEKIKKYAAINEQETKDYAELKAEIERLNNCLMESLTHEKDALDKSIEIKAENERLLKQKNNVMRKNIVLYATLQEIKVICDYENEYNSIGIDDYKRMIKDILDLITKAEEE